MRTSRDAWLLGLGVASFSHAKGVHYQNLTEIDDYDAAVTACMNGSPSNRTACLAGAAASLITLLTAIAKAHANCIAGTVPGTPVPFPDE